MNREAEMKPNIELITVKEKDIHKNWIVKQVNQ